jgi:hypothetical protein
METVCFLWGTNWTVSQVASISQLTVSQLSRQCVILNISQPYRPPRPVTGIASYLLSINIILTHPVFCKTFLKWGSAYTGQHKHRKTQTYIQALIEIFLPLGMDFIVTVWTEWNRLNDMFYETVQWFPIALTDWGKWDIGQRDETPPPSYNIL